MLNINNIGKQKGSKESIIQALRLNGPVSRIELAELTGLSRATISIAAAELIDSNLVKETELRQSTGGRPAIALQLAPNTKAILGAEFGNQEWTLGAFDLLGNVLQKANIPVTDNSPETVANTLINNIDTFVQNLNISPVELLGLGLPGLVDSKQGIIHSASDIGWYNVDIGKKISEEIGWPTVLMNRHRAQGLSECRYGAGQNFNQVIYIGIGTGIAAGLFHNRNFISGAIGGAGELGHITIEPNGPLCPCGNRGCLQLLATGPAMEKEARMLLRSGTNSLIYSDPSYDLQLLKAEDIYIAADNNDELSLQVVQKAATYLGIAMANLVNILNPEAIILGGSIPRNCDNYVKTAVKVMKQRAMGPLTANILVTNASFSEIGGALGAANFAFDKLISSPLFNSTNL
ncbi:ROK family transcriptional regulator [Bacillus sp. FSL K6-3431]|uniref:ROK family transcriptional regulator n=1 Tax=Bacillus sp. FSL K6-3431 TaxID=2921500 RepID=UPI0030F8CA0B